MNFQKISPVESTKTFLDIAFKKARQKGKQKNLTGNWLQIIRQKECLKIDIIKYNLATKLKKILEEYPDTRVLSSFYIKLMKLTLDFPQFKKSLGALNWAIQKIGFFQKEYVRKIIKTKEKSQINFLSKQFYGRISSILKQIKTNLQFLEQARKIMRTYPDIKPLPTVCIYGFPNVGKTTLLNKLTQTKAKIASYAFTTTTINAGYLKTEQQTIQILDVPGTLARKERMNNIELQAELVFQELADLIIYVFDLSEFGGYSIKKQQQLFRKITQTKPLLVYFSKTDLIKDKQFLQEFQQKYKPHTIEKIKTDLLKTNFTNKTD